MSTQARVELTAVDRTKAAFDSLNRNLQSIGDRVGLLGGSFGRLGSLLSTGLGPAAIGGAVAGLATLAKAQADSLDQFNDLKDATGASIENLSALDDVARRNGATLDTVGAALVKFNNTLKDANDPEKGAGAVFKALGLEVEKLKRMDPAEALRVTAVAFAGFADDGNKARAVMELTGKSIREMAPFLKDLAEQQQLNAKVTTEQAEESEKFNKNLAAMQTHLNEIGRTLAGPMISGFNNLVAGIKDANKESDSWLLTLLKLQPHYRAMLEVAKLMGKRGEPAPAPGAAPVAFESGFTFVAPSLNVRETDKDKPKKDKKEKDDRQWLENRKQFLRDTDEYLERLADWAKREAATVDAAAKVIGDAWDDEQAQIAAFVKKQAGRDGQMDAELDRLSGRTSARNDAALRARIGERVASGAMSAEDAAKATKELDDAIKKTTDSSKEFGQAFTSALGDMLSGAKDLKGVLKSLATDILSIGLQKSITQPLGASLGSMLSGLFSFDGGGYTGSGPRSGGLDGKGGYLAMLHPRETVIDHTKGQAAPGGVSNSYNIVVNATDNASKADLAAAVEFALRQAEQRQRRAAVYGA